MLYVVKIICLMHVNAAIWVGRQLWNGAHAGVRVIRTIRQRGAGK